MRHYTLRERLALVTPEHLGPEADESDARAYRAELARAWPAGAVTLAGDSLAWVEEWAWLKFCKGGAA